MVILYEYLLSHWISLIDCNQEDIPVDCHLCFWCQGHWCSVCRCGGWCLGELWRRYNRSQGIHGDNPWRSHSRFWCWKSRCSLKNKRPMGHLVILRNRSYGNFHLLYKFRTNLCPQFKTNELEVCEGLYPEGGLFVSLYSHIEYFNTLSKI